jgi:hypothetical protein
MITDHRITRSLWKGLLVPLCLTAVSFLALPADASDYDATGQSRYGSFRGFPLWKDVPTRRFAVLKEGQNRRGTRWGVYAYRDRGVGRDRPCILLASITFNGIYGLSSGCGPLAPSTGRKSLPVLVGKELSYSKGIGEPFVSQSFYALTVAVEVRRVQLVLDDGSKILRVTKRLNPRQGKKARLARFGYVTISVLRDVCIEEVNGLNGAGSVVLEADFEECSLR